MGVAMPQAVLALQTPARNDISALHSTTTPPAPRRVPTLLVLLSKVKAAIAPFYKVLLCVFNFYCLTPSQSIRGAFSIQPNQFGKMMQDADLAGNSISVEEIGKIFVMVNFETDKVSLARRK